MKIRWPRAQYPFVAALNCHSFHRDLSSQTHHLAWASVLLQALSGSMSGPISQVNLLGLAAGVAKSGSTGIPDEEHPAGPSNIMLPSEIAEIQANYARNVDSGIGSLHQIWKVPHATWLGLDHVAALFDVPGTVVTREDGLRKKVSRRSKSSRKGKFERRRSLNGQTCAESKAWRLLSAVGSTEVPVARVRLRWRMRR